MTPSMNAAARAEPSSSAALHQHRRRARVRLDVVRLVAEPLEARAGSARSARRPRPPASWSSSRAGRSSCYAADHARRRRCERGCISRRRPQRLGTVAVGFVPLPVAVQHRPDPPAHALVRLSATSVVDRRRRRSRDVPPGACRRRRLRLLAALAGGRLVPRDVAALGLVELGRGPPCTQLLVGALLDQPAWSIDQDLVRLADRREAVGDHERGAAPIRRSSASRITASVFESIDEVGSSRIRIGASLRNARATQMRWRSPPDSCAPRSPSSVS